MVIFAIIKVFAMKRALIYLFFLLALNVQAQFMRSYSPSVRSLQMMFNDDWHEPPILRLGGDDVISFSFDEMSHIYRRYIYRIVHCNAHWESSELFEIDYLDGFNDMPIEDWENSENTTVHYTNYTFSIPNENVSLKLSGNYKVEVYDDDADDEELVAEFRFSVVEPCVALSASVSGNTDIDFNKNHQQLSFTVHYPKYTINNPSTEILAVVCQNRRYETAVENIKPTYITGDALQYIYNEKLIFDAGNEYRRFEITDPRVQSMGVESIENFDSYYHVDLYTDNRRFSHSNNRDENGRFFINTLEGYGTSIEADYMFVHFELNVPFADGGSYYLLGDFCGNHISSSNRLEWDSEDNVYRVTKLLKMGLYNYMYVWVPDGSSKGYTGLSEGDFYETENEYLIFIYHRPFGARYDKLIGYGRYDYRIERN